MYPHVSDTSYNRDKYIDLVRRSQLLMLGPHSSIIIIVRCAPRFPLESLSWIHNETKYTTNENTTTTSPHASRIRICWSIILCA